MTASSSAATKIIIEYPALHPIATKWNNVNSAWFHMPEEFLNCFTSVDDKELTTVYHVLRTFREGNSLKKTDDNQISIKQFLSDPDYPKKVEEYYNGLRSIMDAPEELSLPYSTNSNERKKALVSRLCRNNDLLDPEKAAYRLVRGFYADRYLEYPFAIEALAIPYKKTAFRIGGNIQYKTKIIGSVNYSISPRGAEFEQEEGDEYVWVNGGGWTIRSKSIRDIFEQLGFRFDLYYHESKTKVPSIILVNLVSPRVDYHGHDKSKIDVKPFEHKIVEIAKKIANAIPSFRQIGIGFKGSEHNHRLEYNSNDRDEDQDAREYLWNFLTHRWEDVNRDPSLIIKDRITQSGVWYRIRPDMVIGGFKPKKDWGKTRRYVTGIIEEMCLEISKGKAHREDFGIVAAARAIMYYKGTQIPINFDNFRALAKNGVAIVVIEKEGIPQVLASHAAKYGVALVNTRGRLTRDGIAFIEEIKRLGSIVVLFVDYDAVGQDIIKGTKTKTPVLGVHKETVAWFQQNGYPNLKIADVEEEYEPTITTDDEYLQRYRIELDSIMAKVGAEAFWKYMVHRLELKEFSPNGFDYRDEITIPESKDIYPKDVSDFYEFLNDHTQEITEDERERIEDDELKSSDKLLDVEDKELDIKDNKLKPIVEKDKVMILAASRLKELSEELKDLLK